MARPLLRAGLLLAALALPVAGASDEPLPTSLASVALGPPEPALLAELETQPVRLADAGAQAQAALVLFRKPCVEVLRLLSSTPRQKEYRPELTRLEVIEAGPRGDLAEYRVRFMLTSLVYRARHGWDMQSGKVWWTLDPSFDNDMQVLEGLWELREIDAQRTLGRFATRIDLGPAVPAFLQDYATRKKLPESMEQLRLWVDSGGSWRP